MCTHMLAYLYHSGPHADFNTHVATVRGKLTSTAAFSGTQVENVAFWLKSLPTHGLVLWQSLLYHIKCNSTQTVLGGR